MTYEYECTKCGRTFEAEQRITDPPLTEHELVHPQIAAFRVVCKGPLKRLVAAAPAFVLKGTGWAKDGYK